MAELRLRPIRGDDERRHHVTPQSAGWSYVGFDLWELEPPDFVAGGKDARDSLKKRFRRDMNRDEALRVAIEALIDAADEDLGTGGPDLLRGILPSVKTITRSGFADAPEDEIRRHCEAVLNDRNRL